MRSATIGGGTLLALNLAWIMKPEWFGLPSGQWPHAGAGDASHAAGFSVGRRLVAGFFDAAVSAGVRAEAYRARCQPADYPFEPLSSDCYATARGLRGHRQAFLMLLAFLIYNDGIGTIIRMASIYADELKINQNDDHRVDHDRAICRHSRALFCSGCWPRRIGAKRSIAVGLLAYMAICIFGYYMTTGTHFLMLAVLVGAVQGGTQALSRSLFASLIPKDKSGEFFGFFGVAEKFAGILGPAIFVVVSSRNAILAIIAFFVVGGALLFVVDVGRANGRRGPTRRRGCRNKAAQTLTGRLRQWATLMAQETPR